MKPLRFAAPLAIILVAVVALLYNANPTRSSDHQDSNTVLARPGADITDTYLFPSPTNSNNVVIVMDVSPLIPAGMGTATFFDPAVMYQFKFAHGAMGTTANEDTVIQLLPNGTGSSQTLTVFGPAAPVQTGTSNTFVSAIAGTVGYNVATTLSNGMQVFAGPRSDPFFVDLFQFFKIVPDRNASYHQPGQTVPAASASSFNGFAAGSGCLTTASTDTLGSNKFNVLSIVIELPKTMLAPTSGSQIVHMWATTSTTTGA